MTPERAKELLPIITAYASGETIQFNSRGEWTDVIKPGWYDGTEYRVKPKTPEYRLYRFTDRNQIVGIATRNDKTPSGKYHLDALNESVKLGLIVWLSDWMPIPNYKD